jgi:uncharacterized protein (TIGR04551 family)
MAAAVAIAGCATFHAAPLPGAPADATFVDVDGVHVHYRDEGTGPAVVMIHGFGGSLEHWSGVAPKVAAAGHRVIRIDLEGFGWTSRPYGDYSPAAQGQLVWHVLDKLGVHDVAIVGHSWGASVALSMAVQQPGRTSRVALYSAYVYDEQVPSFFRWAQRGGIGEALFTLFYDERIEDRAPLAYYDERWVTQQRIDRVEDDLARPGTTAAALAAVRGHHFAALHDALRAFTKPVLLLWGAQDQVTPVSFGHRLAAELQDADIHVYERCGHVPMVEAANRSTRDLIAFLVSSPAPAETTSPPPSTDKVLEGPAIPSRSNRVAYDPFTFAADLTALGAELAPRQYAAPRETTELVVHGMLRVREAALYNLDLDRGLDTAGRPLFPVPLDGGQLIKAGDIRARTDLAVYARGVGVAAKARIDWLDNVALGGDPDLAGGSPATSGGQQPAYATVRRAWGEVLTPAGTLALGRMGAHFGLGIAANGGDCEDCDGGDAADRVAFVSPLFGHFVAFAYDIAARGPFTASKDGGHDLVLAPTASAGGPTFAIFKSHSPATLARRADAGLTTLEYAAYVTRRTQDDDVPASYLPAQQPAQTFTSDDLVGRGFAATGTGAWLRVSSARFRLEAELAYFHARIDQPSLIPGAAITEAATSDQLGFALQSHVVAGPTQLGLDGGYASGDDAPGFGAFPTTTGDAQVNFPRDRTVDNFRFHPDYRIDQILFREIIGTITDAVYVRPHVRATLLTVGTGRIEALAALIASWAVEPTSTPSGERALGVELDPELRFASTDGFVANVAYGLLLPGAAFDSTNLSAKPAQALRVRVGFIF